MTTVKLGDFVSVVRESQTLLYKVTKFDNEHFWGALVVDKENKKCRKGRPSKMLLKDIKVTTTNSKTASAKKATTSPAKAPLNAVATTAVPSQKVVSEASTNV